MINGIARIKLIHCSVFLSMVRQCYASHQSNLVFDQQAKLKQRNYAALLTESRVYDYIREKVAFLLSDRVCDISRKFNLTLDIGCSRGYLSQFLTSSSVNTLFQCDSSVEIAKQILPSNEVQTCTISCPEEFPPFRPDTFDLILTCMSIHWVNDLQGLLRRVIDCLRKDGCFLGVMPASDTLFELRVSLQLAELERLGGIYPHVSPFVDNIDMADLLQQAGFKMITIDIDNLVIHYPNMFELMNDLRLMGESNAILDRAVHLSRDVLLAASSIYDERFGELRQGSTKNERCLPATFRLLYFIGWKPM